MNSGGVHRTEKDQVAELERQLAAYKRRAAIKNVCVPLICCSATAFLGFFLKSGIDAAIKGNLSFLEAKWLILIRLASYGFVSCVFFPLIGCIISKNYQEIKCNFDNLIDHSKAVITNKENPSWSLWFQECFADFTSEENLPRNAKYYSSVFAVGITFCALQYFTWLGIDQLYFNFAETKVMLKIFATVSFALLYAIFTNSLKEILWQDVGTKIEHTEIVMTDPSLLTVA